MLPNPHFPADLVTFTEKNLNGKLHFLYKVTWKKQGNLDLKSQNFESEKVLKRKISK